MMRKNNAVLERVARQTSRFRQANPKVKAPSSVFQVELDDIASLYTTESTVTSTNFTFDSVVINSQAYRRALNQSKSSQNLTALREQSEVSSDSATIVGSQLSQDEVKNLVKDHELLRGRYQKVKGYLFEESNYVETLQKGFTLWKETKDRELSAMNKDLIALKKEKDAESKRMVAETQEMELSMIHLHEEAKRFSEYFRANNAKRKLLIENHQAELELKEKIIRELHRRIDEDERKARKQDKTIIELQKKLADVKFQESRVEELQEKLQAEKQALMEELQQYKSLDRKLYSNNTIHSTPG